MGPAESRRRRHRISGKPSGEKWNAGWVWELGVLELSRLAALKETHNETNRRVWQSSNSTALQWAMSLVCVITPPQRHSKTAYDSAVRLRQPPSLPRPGCQAIPSCRFPTFCTLAVPFLLNVAVLELQLLVRDRPSRGHGKQLLDPRVAVAQLTSSHGARCRSGGFRGWPPLPLPLGHRSRVEAGPSCKACRMYRTVAVSGILGV